MRIILGHLLCTAQSTHAGLREKSALHNNGQDRPPTSTFCVTVLNHAKMKGLTVISKNDYHLLRLSVLSV